MTMVASYDWESDTWTHHTDEKIDQALPDTRTIWRQAVYDVVTKAAAALPVELTSRIKKAEALVLSGDVELLPDGQAKVASQSDSGTIYFVVNGECQCKDFAKAPQGFCKHRLAYGIQKRATALFTHRMDQLDQASNGVSQSPADAPVRPSEPVETPSAIPSQYLITIQGKPFVRFAGLLQMAHERGLSSLTADWTYNDGELSLAHAVARFSDGRSFEESGDATPTNTNRKVAPHFRRVALTRAKARVLRDALGIDLVAVEELSESE